MLGYYNNPDATDEVIIIHSDGERWLHTGDLGYIDEVIYVIGQIKRIIVTKGDDGQPTKMFPDRIERAIYSHSSVELCCVIDIADKRRINYPKAFIVLKEGSVSSDNIKKEIIKKCKVDLPEYMIPEEIEFMDDLPRTERGKVDYRTLEMNANV